MLKEFGDPRLICSMLDEFMNLHTIYPHDAINNVFLLQSIKAKLAVQVSVIDRWEKKSEEFHS